MIIAVMRKESLKKNSVAFNFRRLFKRKHSSNLKPSTVIRMCSSCTNKKATKHWDSTHWTKKSEQPGQ